MNTRQNAKSDSSIEQQIQAIHLPQHERDQVLRDAHVAEAFVEFLTWAGGKLYRPTASYFAKPSPKY
ncbi:MAG: hypothetical protein ACRET6_11420 [Burkholderiales bacterium]